MEAPENIYLQVCGDCKVDCNDCNCKFDEVEDNVTWSKDRIFDKDVEYTRTDAFIEKACEFIVLNISDYIDVTYKGADERISLQQKFIDEFKNYMKW